MDNISDKTIADAVYEIFDKLGFRDAIDSETEKRIYDGKSLKEISEEIAKAMLLPVKVQIETVWGRPGDTNNFKTSQVAKYKGRGGGEGISAQVEIPGYLPMYGSTALINFPIKVFASRECINNKEAFAAVMSHELTHVMLTATNHQKFSDNELYTDLSAMMLGFRNIMDEGRKVSSSWYQGNTTYTNTTTYGYLDDHQFSFAKSKILDIEKRCYSLSQSSTRLRGETLRLIAENLGYYENISRRLEDIDRAKPDNIRKKKLAKIMEAHQIDFDAKSRSLANKKEIVEKHLPVEDNIKSYTLKWCEELEKATKSVVPLSEELKAEQKDLRRYMAAFETDSWFRVHILRRLAHRGHSSR